MPDILRRQWHPTPDFLAWKTPWMGEPGATEHARTHMHWIDDISGFQR